MGNGDVCKQGQCIEFEDLCPTTTHSYTQEPTRSSFQGMWEPSPVDGMPVVVEQWRTRIGRMFLSHGVLATLVCCRVASLCVVCNRVLGGGCVFIRRWHFLSALCASHCQPCLGCECARVCIECGVDRWLFDGCDQRSANSNAQQSV